MSVIPSKAIRKLVSIPTKEAKAISAAVHIAKGMEESALELYRKHAQKTNDKELRSAFEFLAKEEQEHFDSLSLVEKTLKESSKFAVISNSLLKHLPKPAIYTAKKAKAAGLHERNEITVLLWAMRSERKNELFYIEEAKKARLKEAKQFFGVLAEFELEHFEFLDSILSSWVDMEDFIMG